MKEEIILVIVIELLRKYSKTERTIKIKNFKNKFVFMQAGKNKKI